MNRSIYYYLGVVVGIIVAVIAVSIVSLCKKKKGGCEFDERQELARTRASKYGFITLTGYLLIFGLLDDMGVFSFGTYMTSNLVGICLGVGVFAINSIWNDAYFSLRERPARFIFIFIVLLFINAFAAVRCIMDGESLTTVSWNIIVAVLLLFVMGTIGLKRLKDRHCDEAE